MTTADGRRAAGEPTSTDPEQVGANRVSAETVSALYLALLNRAPDPEGLQFWTKATSVDEVVRALSDTDEHRQMVQGRVQVGTGGVERDFQAGEVVARLGVGDGLVSLEEREVVLEALGTFPWSEVEGDPVWVLGPYGSELADELVRRGCTTRVHAGLSAAERRADGCPGSPGLGEAQVLVLTEEPYVHALARLRPDVTGGHGLRVLLHPVSVTAGTPAEEVQRTVRLARERLHRLGFIEVSQVFARRCGGGTVVLDRTYTTPEVGRLHEHASAQVGSRPPRSVWLVGRRIPAHDRS